MKHRSPGAVFLLSIVTFGIYDLYWLYKTKAVLNKETQFHTPSLWLLIAPTLLLIAAYIGLVLTLPQSTSSDNNGAYFGSTSTTTTHPSAAFFVVLIGLIIGWLLIFFISAFWFFRFSKAVNEYTHGRMSTAVTFLVLWLIHLIGVALVQDAFNDSLGSAGGTPPSPPMAPLPPTVPTTPSPQPPTQPVS